MRAAFTVATGVAVSHGVEVVESSAARPLAVAVIAASQTGNPFGRLRNVRLIAPPLLMGAPAPLPDPPEPASASRPPLPTVAAGRLVWAAFSMTDTRPSGRGLSATDADSR
ncbi:MAG: hypothetical protein JOY94_22760 [Methylobacteriaceae bacterium]|nr:hypothetical protein [Methylobacteriaceae bacterium]MBV9635905.1 hypothetical protein [Methylobacteriaceae bacterium]